ncbi:MAG: hypothetical protein GDA53_00480 [Rhodobacteraceae bacterium]|nr:hypothetical protein [Paracoccaceae bacterium]
MVKKMLPALIIPALILSACNGSEVPPPPDTLPPAPADQQYFDCIAGGDPAPLLGLTASQAAFGHQGPVRIIPPGTVVAQDYDISRLNLRTSAAGLVQRAYCG